MGVNGAGCRRDAAQVWTPPKFHGMKPRFVLSSFSGLPGLSSGMSGDRYNVSAVERALDVLNAFTHQRPELSLTDIASITKLHKATAFRLLATLCHRGMAMKNPTTGLYRLGFGVIALSEVAKTSTGFVSQARPSMRRVRDELNETVYIAVRVGDVRISLDQLEGLRDIRRVVAIGTPTPLYVGSTSRVLLAAMPDEEIAAYFSRTAFVPPFPGAKVDAPTLWRAIAEIRRDGYAETYNKRIDEGASISAAVRGPANEVVGALTVSVPIGRYTAEVRGRAIEVVTEAARALSRQLGAPESVTGGAIHRFT
jgi:DNA-binding IclR family transcriptional regulator